MKIFMNENTKAHLQITMNNHTIILEAYMHEILLPVAGGGGGVEGVVEGHGIHLL